MIRSGLRHVTVLRRDTRGSIAVEFALVAPVLIIVLAGVIDIGSAAYARHSLQSRVTAAAEYALMADLEDADKLADRIMGLLRGSSVERAAVNVNNAVRMDWDGSSVTKSSGLGDAGTYYCIGSDGKIAWNSAGDRDTVCPTGDAPGQFVQISAAASHVSIFPGYAFRDGDTVSARAVLRVN